MMHLNLISEESRREIKLRYISEVIKRINYAVLIMVIFLAGIFYFFNLILKGHYKKLTEQPSLVIQDNQESSGQAKEMSARLDYISGLQKEFVAWSSVLDEISKKSNREIIFYSISLNKKQKQVMFRGLAESRDGLIDLKEELEKSEFFANINFPIKNLLEQTNINFEINADLKI